MLGAESIGVDAAKYFAPYTPYIKPTVWGESVGQISTSTGNATAGRTYLTPVRIDRTIDIDKISFGQITAGGGSTFFRVGIYADNGRTPVGGALLFDSGNVAADVGTAVQKSITAAKTLARGYWWVALMTPDVNFTFGRHASTDLGDWVDMEGCRYDRAGAAVGAFTDPCPAVTRDLAARWGAYLNVTRVY